MARISSKMRALMRRCQSSPGYFIENFAKIKHPAAGIIPFRLFDYQKKSLTSYRKHRYNIYKKNRQCGISTLTGAYALWLAMFYPSVTVLIVSKRDLDAKDFLSKNIMFPYEELPKDFRLVYGDPPPTYRGHEIVFPNRSIIRSLTSSKNTLRANSSTLNIVDESAFMPDMEEMWAAGQPTLIHGGSVIVISTCKGKGNWYHNTWEDAIAGVNDFNPIEINWWDMDWEIQYRDKYSKKMISICPTRGMRDTTEEERPTYGPHVSPWLKEQLRALQQKGEGHLFKQEVLAEFLGSGNTVVETETLLYIESTRRHDYLTVKTAPYIHPQTGQEYVLDFQDLLHVWEKPVKSEPDTIENGMVIKPGKSGHSYTIGVDISTGEATDSSAAVVFDADAKEQVAEINIKIIPKLFAMMIDYIARWYNGALIVPERTGIGAAFCQELEYVIGYANLYRQRLPAGKRNKKVGFPTSAASKPTINKQLMDMLGEDGFQIYSHRLYKQLGIYVYLTGNKTGAEPGSGNHDDLVIAAGLGLIGIPDAVQMDVTAMVPTLSTSLGEPLIRRSQEEYLEERQNFAAKGGLNLLMPVIHGGGELSQANSPAMELEEFTKQLGGLTKDQMRQMQMNRTSGVVPRKHVIKRGKYSK